jgi:tetratricopeptide (TPR) repeat protein
VLEPLSIQDAGRLLDAQPHPPRGRARQQVLAQAAGNPMVLIELARIIAADPAAGRRWAAEPLPPTERLATALAAQSRALPGPTREALLLAAVADGPDLTSSVPGLTAEALAPAEAAGLIKVDRSGAQFRHPLVRATVYHAVPFAERAAAHLTIADMVRDQPDRYAWHLAAAALGPDERVAALLEATADQAQRRGGAAAAARALEHAAELSPADGDRARRLLAAGTLALDAGQADWVRELASRVLALTTDPEQGIAARMLIGWAVIWSNRPAEALGTLLAVVAEAGDLEAGDLEAGDRLPLIAWSAIGRAATAAYHWGTTAGYQAVLSALDGMHEPEQPSAGMAPGYAEVQRLWAGAVAGPFGQREQAITRLHRLVDGAEDVAGGLAPSAWLLDETELAIRLFRDALGRLRAPGVRGGSPPVLAALLWAYIDGGRWDEALATAREAADAAAAYKLETIACSADLGTATVLALRGDQDRIEPAWQASFIVAAGASPYATYACVDTWLTDFRADLPKFDVPTLVVHGTEDRILPFEATAKRLPGLIKDLTLVPVEGGPHNVGWTFPDEVNTALLDFLRK